MGGGSPPRKGKKDSRFHEGKTLSKTLTKSSFGRFLRVIQERRLENSKFSKPIVITIGVECAGKSSLYEFLMKCEMFPRNNKPCTLGPIRFILVNAEEESVTITFRGATTRLARKEEILGHLQGVMDTLVDEQGNPIIIEDELIVELHSPDEVKGNLADWKKKCKREKDAARKRASRARAKIDKENKALKSALEAEKKVSASLKERLEKAETELANARCGLESERKRCKMDLPASFLLSVRH
eukprot:jgi/Mesvir1/13375/Mv05857-RA.1